MAVLSRSANLKVRATKARASGASRPAKQGSKGSQLVGAGIAATTLAMTLGANAATIKLGGDNGELAFVPSTTTVKAGEKIDFVNNAGFPHNVVFDEDGIPVRIFLRHCSLQPQPARHAHHSFKLSGWDEWGCGVLGAWGLDVYTSRDGYDAGASVCPVA